MIRSPRVTTAGQEPGIPTVQKILTDGIVGERGGGEGRQRVIWVHDVCVDPDDQGLSGPLQL